MQQPAPATNVHAQALAAVKARFVRVPSSTTWPNFKDLQTGLRQADATILLDFYHRNGGRDASKPSELLDCLEWVYGETFQPNGPAITKDQCLNLWKPAELQPSSSEAMDDVEVAPFLAFLARWFPDADQRRYFLWWMAHVVRRPEKRIIATPVLRSEHGVGKGFFAETLMATLVGSSSCAVLGLKQVVGDFNDAIAGKTFILIDEVYRSRKTTTDTLKSFQGNGTIVLRRKGIPDTTIQNFINFIITSNDHIPLDLEEGDRRMWIPDFIRHKQDVKETGHFINRELKPWLESGGFQLVRNYLETVDLAQFHPTAAPPSTAAKADISGLDTNSVVQDALEPLIAERYVITLEGMKLALAGKIDERISDRTITSALMAAGCKMRRSKSKKFYITPAGFEAGYSLDTSPKECEAALSAIVQPSLLAA